MFKRCVARTWFILFVVTGSLATQSVTSFGFGRESDTVVLRTVLEVEKLDSIPTVSLLLLGVTSSMCNILSGKG